MAWGQFYDDLDGYRLNTVAAHLGIPPEPEPHSAIHGAKLAYQVYKKIMDLRRMK